MLDKLKHAGASVEHIHLEGMIHAFMLLQDLVLEECDSVYEHTRKFINR